MSLDRARTILQAAANRGYSRVRLGAIIRVEVHETQILEAARDLGYTLQRIASETWIVLS